MWRVRRVAADDDLVYNYRMSNYLTAAEAAAALGITRSLVCRYCRQGRLRARRVSGQTNSPYLIPAAAVRQFVRRPVGRPAHQSSV